MVAWPSMSSSAEVNSVVPGSVVPREIASSAFGPLRTFVGLSGKHDSLEPGGLVWDQADGAFGSAAVPRPAGSSFMPLRRPHRRPGPAKSLERRAPKPPAPWALDGGRARGWGSGLALRYGKTRPDPHGAWGAEERSSRVGARSALRHHFGRGCPNAENAVNAVSSAARPSGEHHRAVGAFSARPLQYEPPPGCACRDARQRQRPCPCPCPCQRQRQRRPGNE